MNEKQGEKMEIKRFFGRKNRERERLKGERGKEEIGKKGEKRGDSEWRVRVRIKKV